MKVIVPKRSGFCPGVKHAEKKLFKTKNVEGNTPIYVYGYMINNSNYIKYLEENRIYTVESPEGLPEGALVVIRTHGIDRRVEAELRKRFDVIDLTCPNVKRVQLKLQEESDKGALVVITGKKTHPEVLGLVSYAARAEVIENEEDLARFIEWCKSHREEVCSRFSKIFVASQTTGSRNLFVRVLTEVRSSCNSDIPVEEFNSICPITANKEKDSLKIQKRVNVTFVIGDPLSSNANKLYTVLKNADPSTFFIQDAEELKSIALSGYKVAQVVSSASTPEFVEEAVISYLEEDHHGTAD